MTTPPSHRPRLRVRRTLLIGAAGLALAASIGVGLLPRPATPPDALPAGAAPPTGVDAPRPLTLPEHPRVLVFGDSWTYGSAATVRTEGYAYVLADLIGGTTVVDGVRGSGYMKPGMDGPAFGERIARLDPGLLPDLVIVQGSINDRWRPATGYDRTVEAAWNLLAEKFPNAAVVVLGPAPQVLPVQKATARMDRDLQRLAGARSWWYVSPVQQKWITPENYGWIIDTGAGKNHPTTAGHRYLAEKLADALDAMHATPVTVAVESDDTSQQ